jgi:hypothetical protein
MGVMDREPRMIRVVLTQPAEGVLRVRCAGTVGIGTESTASMRPVGQAITEWMHEHGGETVREIEVDFRDVDYRWGDAPIACFVPFLRNGVQQFRFLAGATSGQALESLFAGAKMPWFSVQRLDASTNAH